MGDRNKVMTSYNYKEPNPQDSEKAIEQVKRALPNLVRKVHEAVTNSTSTKQPLQKAQNQNG